MNRLAFVDQWRAGNLPAEAILDLTPVAIYATDADGRITYFNEPSAALWGARPVLGETMWCGSLQIFLPDGTPVPHDRCPMAVCLAENRPVNDIELIVEGHDGQRRHVVVNPRPLRGADGSLRGAVNTLIDVTEKRQAERARSQSEAFARHILESSQDCIKLLDLDGNLQSINALRLHQPGDRRSRPGDRPQLFRFLERRGARRCPGGCRIRTPDRLRTLHRHLSRAAPAASRCGTR